MRFLALAVLLASPAGAAVIQLPTEWSPAPLTGMGRVGVGASAQVVPLDPASLPVLPDLTRSLSALPWTPAAQAFDSRARSAASDPAQGRLLVPTATRPENARVEERRENENSETLVRDLLARLRTEEKSGGALFDGTGVLPDAEIFPELTPVGADQVTRHGVFTLASVKTRKSHDGTIGVYERWTGADGRTVWVKRVKGPDSWQISEWHGNLAPLGFEPNGLPLPAAHYAEIELRPNGRLISNIETKPGLNKNFSSTFVDAKKSMEAALAWFGDRVGGIKGTWVYGDNLAEFNRLTGLGMTPEEAALQTWTGKRAAAAGYTKVIFSADVLRHLHEGKPGQYKSVAATFLKP